MPGLLIEAPPRVREAFDHAWAPMTALATHARCLPGELYQVLLGFSGGFVVVSTGESRYVAGSVDLGRWQARNVAFVSVEDLARDNERPLHVIGHLIDHHLGCGGDPDGLWLSQGGGVNSPWLEAGVRLSRLFALGYGADEIAQENAQDYFAQSLALYCRDRQRLNVADPQIYKWLRNTLWNRAFWTLTG